MVIVILDLEGVLIPEIWQAIARTTGIYALNRTTRDEPNYETLMNYRLDILKQHYLRYSDIANVITTLVPMPGARVFFDSLRIDYPCIILSDTFTEFARPLLLKLGLPAIFCHNLFIEDGIITGYQLRQKNQKKNAVDAFRHMGYEVIAVGDSFNDCAMLESADQGFFFRAPDAIHRQYPHIPMFDDYYELREAIDEAAKKLRTRALLKDNHDIFNDA